MSLEQTWLALKAVLPGDLLSYGVVVFGSLLFYGLLAGSVWLAFDVALHRWWQRRRISRRGVARRQVRREILLSVRSIALFGLVLWVVLCAAAMGWTRLYTRIDGYGWVWFFSSMPVMIALHDTYFYWTHRLMHHRRLYRFFHRTHHLSLNPTPWAAYAFSPAEALVQAGIGPLIAFLLPVHPLAFAAFLMWQTTFNVLAHCGYEIFPGWFMRCPLSRFLNSVTHHVLHHEDFRANYSLYFNVWDRLMGTNHPDYPRRFEQAACTAVSATSSSEPT